MAEIDDAKVAELYEKHGGDMDAVAQELGMAPAEFDQIEPEVSTEPVFISPDRTRPRLVGRPELRQYMISIRHMYETGWPRADKAVIERARRAYDAGYVEMCQARDGNWIILYSIRRKKKALARNWFTPLPEVAQP